MSNTNDSSDSDRHARQLQYAETAVFDEPLELEHGGRLPAVTVVYLHVVDWMVSYGLFLLMAVVALVFVFALARVIEDRFEHPGPVSRLVAWLRWSMPITRTLDY